MKLAQAALLALVAGFALGFAGRWILRSRVRLSVAEATLCGIVGAIVGGGIAGALVGEPGEATPFAAGVGAIIGTIAVLIIVDRIAWAKRRPTASAPELIKAGESARVEFKSSARYNLHSKQRDERLEFVIAKTVAAFSNTEGGVLLIGVDDDGNPVGLENDLSLMKQPDPDRYELWLGDWLTSTIGIVGAAQIQTSFEQIDGSDICVIRVPASTRPIFVTGKDKQRSFYIRAGNSTRELAIDDALAYCTRRWGARSIRRAAG